MVASAFYFYLVYFVFVHKVSFAMLHILYNSPPAVTAGNLMPAALERLHPRLAHVRKEQSFGGLSSHPLSASTLVELVIVAAGVCSLLF